MKAPKILYFPITLCRSFKKIWILRLLFFVLIDIIVQVKTVANKCQGQSSQYVQKVLIVCIGGVGDYINYLPMLQAIRKTLPDAHLTIIAIQQTANLGKNITPLLISVADTLIEIEEAKLTPFQKLQYFNSADFNLLLMADRGVSFSSLLAAIFSKIPFIIYTRKRFYEQCFVNIKKLFYPSYREKKLSLSEVHSLCFKTLLTFMNKPWPSDYNLIPKLTIDPQEKTQTLQLLLEEYPELKTADHKIFIHPGSSIYGKKKRLLRYWPTEYWKNFLSKLIIRYPKSHVILLGGPDDEEIIQALTAHINLLPKPEQNRIINLAGKIPSIKELATLISLADILVCCDSAPMHIAVAAGVRLVAIFTGSSENEFLPKDERFSVAARQDLFCRPCLFIYRSKSCDNPICLDVPVELVLEKIEYQLKQCDLEKEANLTGTAD